MFKGGDSFSILTNSFYKNDRGELEWFPRLGKDVQKFFCYAFIPNDDISNRIKEIFINSYYLDSTGVSLFNTSSVFYNLDLMIFKY